jgi:hypothetical protein
MLYSAAPAIEKIGSTIFSSFSGVIIIEAVKQIYAGHPTTERKQKRSVITVQQQTQLTQSTRF